MQEKQDTEVKFIVDVLKPNKIQLLCDTLCRKLSENNIIVYHMPGNDLVGSLEQMVQGLICLHKKQGNVFVLTVVQVWGLIIMR